MKNVNKQYERPFLLEPTKLTRLVDKIHELLGTQPNTTQHDSFEVFLTGNRHEEMTSVDDVLELDNSRKHQITRLIVLCTAATRGAAKPEHQVQVDFGYPKPSTPPSMSTTKVVTVDVRSDAGGWADRTLSEVEEQIERTWQPQGMPFMAALGAVLLAVSLLVALLPSASLRVDPDPKVLWLNGTNLDSVATMLKEQSTLSDQQLREVATMQLRNVLGPQSSQGHIDPTQRRRVLFLAVPLLVIFGSIVVLLTTCYPSTVFYWGDGVKRQDGIVQRRKVVWGIILGVTVIGISSNLLWLGLSTWLPPTAGQ